jgi:hypothetical protein
VLQTIRHLLIRPRCFRLERELPGGIGPRTQRTFQGTHNVPMESFFASLKKEHVHQASFRTREEANGFATE